MAWFTRTRSGYARGATGPAGGSSGITQSYIGYNTVGAVAAASAQLVYLQKVVLASAGFLASIGAYVAGAPSWFVPATAVYSDNAGVPLRIIAENGPSPNAAQIGAFIDTNARWIDAPIGVWLPAGTFWMGITDYSRDAGLNFYHDTGGGDYTGTRPAFYDQSQFTFTNSTFNYSLRGSFLK